MPSETQIIETQWNDPDSPVTEITRAVAAFTGQSPADLPALQTVIDADSLNTLLQTDATEPVQISFTYATVDVTATNNGTIELAASATETR